MKAATGVALFGMLCSGRVNLNPAMNAMSCAMARAGRCEQTPVRWTQGPMLHPDLARLALMTLRFRTVPVPQTFA
jgi:hypothetical protein